MRPLNKREIAILRLLSDAPDEGLYAMDIVRQIYPRWLHWTAGIYIHLMRLEERGLIEHYKELTLEPRLPRYIYRITRRGRDRMLDHYTNVFGFNVGEVVSASSARAGV
jgi:DNA-binding PadR family transcriptional regulator